MRTTETGAARRVLLAAALALVWLVVALPARAESLSSYYDVQAMFGIELTPAAGDPFAFALGFTALDPWIVVEGRSLGVHAICGAAVLGTAGQDLAAAPGRTDSGWAYYEHQPGARADTIAGYRTQPGKAARLDLVDGLFHFQVDAANPAPFSGYGLHVVLSGEDVLPNGSSTGFVRLGRGGHPVPEPSFYQMGCLLALGGLGLLRMRRARGPA